MPLTLSLPEARRLAVAAQGFGSRPLSPSIGHVRKLASRLRAFQIDSVNVLARAHYVPAFARLGPYPMEALDQLAYRKRELFEYWGHEASLLPVSTLHKTLYSSMIPHNASCFRCRERNSSETGESPATGRFWLCRSWGWPATRFESRTSLRRRSI